MNRLFFPKASYHTILKAMHQGSNQVFGFAIYLRWQNWYGGSGLGRHVLVSHIWHRQILKGQKSDFGFNTIEFSDILSQFNKKHSQFGFYRSFKYCIFIHQEIRFILFFKSYYFFFSLSCQLIIWNNFISFDCWGTEFALEKYKSS